MIVDDQEVICEGIKKMLTFEKSFTVVSSARDGTKCLEMISEGEQPDIILMDLKMPGMNGFESVRCIRDKYPGIKVIILTNYDHPKYVEQCIKSGACGYLLKDVNKNDLIEAIKDVMHDIKILDHNLTPTEFNFQGKEVLKEERIEELSLSKRELEVLKSMTKGYSDKEIATELGISDFTSRTHIRNIYRKMGVSSRSQAVVMAINIGLIDFD